MTLTSLARPSSLVAPIVAFAALGARPLAAQVLVQPGFQETEVLDLDGSRAYATFPDGGYLSFDGLAFELYDAAGNWQKTLATLPTSVFPSFVRLDPSGAFALVGENSTGVVYEVDLATDAVAPLVTLDFNYDLAFGPTSDLAYVSASLGGFGTGNDVVRLDPLTGAAEVVAHVDGPSGPLATDGAGNLYYVTQYEGFDWPPPLEHELLLRWDAAELAAAGAGNVLAEADGTVLTRGLDGGSSVAFDAHAARLLLAHVNAQGWENEVLAIGLDGTVLDTLGYAYTWIQNLEPFHGPGEAVLAAHQPANALVYVQNTDFGSQLRDRVRLEPARPLSSFDGPPQGQSGPATVTISGAEPNASVSFLVARSSKLLSSEAVYQLGWGVPVFAAVELKDVQRRTKLVATDASGSATLSFTQTPPLHGALVFQALIYDADGRPLGTSVHVVNQ